MHELAGVDEHVDVGHLLVVEVRTALVHGASRFALGFDDSAQHHGVQERHRLGQRRSVHFAHDAGEGSLVELLEFSPAEDGLSCRHRSFALLDAVYEVGDVVGECFLRFALERRLCRGLLQLRDFLGRAEGEHLEVLDHLRVLGIQEELVEGVRARELRIEPDRTTTKDALLRFADELDSADADAVAAALAIASTRGGIGTRATLMGLSDTIQDRLRALREVATERAKPRAVVRQVTTITLTVIVAAVVLNGSFFEPYLTPIGGVIALTLAACYAGCLLMLRRMSTPPPAPRFLRGQ